MASLGKIIDVHSHIITNLGSQVPTHKLPPWSIEQSMSLMDANGIAASVISLRDLADHTTGPEACNSRGESMSYRPTSSQTIPRASGRWRRYRRWRRQTGRSYKTI